MEPFIKTKLKTDPFTQIFENGSWAGFQKCQRFAPVHVTNQKVSASDVRTSLVQTFQLLYGGGKTELRKTSTMEVLEELEKLEAAKTKKLWEEAEKEEDEDSNLSDSAVAVDHTSTTSSSISDARKLEDVKGK